MSDKNKARRADAEIYFDGVDISASVRNYFISLTYTDNEEDETDDLSISLHDRDGIWLTQWLNAAVQSAAASGNEFQTKGLDVQATIIRENWNADGKDIALDCGQFTLDSVEASGPPSEISIKCSSLTFSSQIRQTKKSKSWEHYYLSGIANEMAAANGLTCIYESSNDPYYDRQEQTTESDITFLSRLCHEAGISLKTTNKALVLFDQAEYEAKAPALTITNGDGSYLKYKLSTGEADVNYASCRVCYTDPNTGSVISGTAYADDYDEENENNQTLEIIAKVNSASDAEQLAAKSLRLRNKYEYTARYTLIGNPGIVAGVTIMLSGWGAWDGKYIVKQAVHKLGGSGYTTQITLRKVLEGY